MKKFSLLVIIIGFGFFALAADEIEVPVDELARESVLPVFDNTVSVKNRNVNKQGGVDIGIFGGMALTEPIANTTKAGVEFNYHFTETHSLGIFYTVNSTGLSRDAQGLKEDFGLDFDRAPKPLNTTMLDYNYSPFYGKLSITKDGVINTTISTSLGAGLVKYEHKSYAAMAIGVGERFFFGKHLSLKIDFKLFAHQAPIPFKRNGLKTGPVPSPRPSLSSFDERLTYTSNLQLGLNYLF